MQVLPIGTRREVTRTVVGAAAYSWLTPYQPVRCPRLSSALVAPSRRQRSEFLRLQLLVRFDPQNLYELITSHSERRYTASIRFAASISVGLHAVGVRCVFDERSGQ